MGARTLRVARARRHLATTVGTTLALTFLVPASAHASPATHGRAGGPQAAIGGAQLASRGLVVDPGAPALPGGLTASAWVVADLDTGAVLAARDAHGRYAPASTIKTLTATTLIPRLSPRSKVTATFDDVNVPGSKVGLVPDNAYSVGSLLRAMLVVSANDAANTLASAAGGMHKTVFLMNETARALGAWDTVARNPSGLDAAGQTSSPYDLALISRAGLRMHDFAGYVATKRSFINAPGGKRFEIYTHNKLLRNYPGAFGVKNGYTVRARASFVGAAARNGHRLVVALMHGDPYVWHDARALLDWGFAAVDRIAPVGTLVDAAPDAAPVTEDAQLPPRASAQRASSLSPAAAPRMLTRELVEVLSLVLLALLLIALRVRARRRMYFAPSRLKLPPLR
ncbi:MAG: D-alanyl-D-alanine carboxypeptidase family protein [Mycobacteriales bacterium]|nr:serine hydrolase [Frankia sp.]